MNRSNPSTEVGGGEMNRDTSSVVSSEKSDAASDARSSRSTTWLPASTGSPLRQSDQTTSRCTCTGDEAAVDVVMIVSISEL